MTEKSDEALFADYVAGDDGAFDTLINRHRPLLVRYVTRLLHGDTHAAEDVVQTTCYNLFRYRKHYDPSKPFQAWMFTIAFRLAKNAKKSTVRRHRRVYNASDLDLGSIYGEEDTELSTRMTADKTNAHQLTEQQEQGRQAMTIVAKLPREFRQSIQALVLDGLSSREAQNIFGMSHSGIQKRCRAAIALVRERLETPQPIEDISDADLRGLTIRDLLGELPADEGAAVRRVALNESTSADDLRAFSDFICRLAGVA